MDFDIVCLVDCDDCGTSVIIDPTFVTIFVSTVDNNFITAVSICCYCEKVILEDIDCIFKERKSNDESKNSITFSGLLNVNTI